MAQTFDAELDARCTMTRREVTRIGRLTGWTGFLIGLSIGALSGIVLGLWLGA